MARIPEFGPGPAVAEKDAEEFCGLNLERQIALLSQEGSGIAKRIPRGVVP